MAIQFEKLNKNSDRPTHISKTGLGKGKQKYFKGWPQEKGLTTKFYQISTQHAGYQCTVLYGPLREKTCLRVSDKVNLKPVCSATETN